MRKIYASRKLSTKLTTREEAYVSVYSFFPIDRASCECDDAIHAFKARMGTMAEGQRRKHIKELGHLECPRDKTGMRRYEIYCGERKCKQVLGYLWATDKHLTDWCDFHYLSWSDGEQWYGCLTPNISPVDEYLGLECCCGNDTRDFRANMTLPGKVAHEIEKRNAVGRRFGEKDSKFKTRLVRNKQVVFKEPWQK